MLRGETVPEMRDAPTAPLAAASEPAF